MKTHEELGIEAAQCGHYPRLTTRLPLWLRLEVGDQDVDITVEESQESCKICKRTTYVTNSCPERQARAPR